VASPYENPISASLKGFQYMQRSYRSGAHQPYHSQIRWVLNSAYPGKVSTGIGTPIAAEANNLGIEVLHV
jgi:hypothetical protein